MTTLRQAIETYIYAKDGNRPHLMSRAFAVNAELVMEVKTEEISFPTMTRGLTGISAVLVSQFAQRYENIYTFCMDTPPDHATDFRCGWLVCMTEKLSGAVRVGFGNYEWSCPDHSGVIPRLKITIEDMINLPRERGDAILEWACTLPYPWCSPDLLLPSAPDIPVIRKIAQTIALNK
jgi:hypothetical protein